MTATATARSLYPLDAEFTDVVVEIPDTSIKVTHRITRPTMDELVERERAIITGTEQVNKTEDRFLTDDESPDIAIWNKKVLALKGVRLKQESPGTGKELRSVERDEEGNPIGFAAEIPGGQRATAFRGLYQATCELELGDEDEFVIGDVVWVVRQLIGDPNNPTCIIRHFIKNPTESQRREYKRHTSETRFKRGASRLQTRILVHLRPAFELYRQMLDRLDGVSLNDEPWSETRAAEFANAMDPILARQALDKLMKHLDADLSD